MSKWFGADWGAPACDPEEHVSTPVGELCCYCDVVIESADQGFIFPLVTQMKGDPSKPLADFTISKIVYHLDCFLKTVLPCPGCPNCKPERYS